VESYQNNLIPSSDNFPVGNLYSEIPSSDLLQKIKKISVWALLSAAREVLQVVARDNGYSTRVCYCCRTVSDKVAGVDVWESAKRFHFGGLLRCSSVWLCPVCAGRISEERRQKLNLAMENNASMGGSAQLWTFTAPHNRSQSLSCLVEALSKARELMLHRKPFKRLAADLGLVGTVRALEVTYSFNAGWHVHFHVLAFLSGVSPSYDLVDIKKQMHEMWLGACLSSGLGAPSFEHGVSVDNGDRAACYVGKWGIDMELTKWHSKEGRSGHLTPFDFLRKHVEGDFRYDGLFREYAEVFSGRLQLMWSRGLADRLGVGVIKSDIEIAESLPDDRVLFANIPSDVWAVILSKELRADVLSICSRGKDALDDFLSGVMDSVGGAGGVGRGVGVFIGKEASDKVLAEWRLRHVA
jgi:hypothetical protein